MDYFSDRELGLPPRNGEQLTLAAWRGIAAAVDRRVRDGSFGSTFPEVCSEYRYPIGTDEGMFSRALQGVVPKISWPLNDHEIPDHLAAFDLTQFCYANVASPQQLGWHDYFRHYRLAFNVERGKNEFRNEINGIFERQGLAFELREDGAVARLAAPELQGVLTTAVFETGDTELNDLLTTARVKFRSPAPDVRKEALEKLWDAWERLKTLEYPADKLQSIRMLLDKSAAEPNFRQLLEVDARGLTDVGNAFMIRHTEMGKVSIQSPEHVEYLFHRLFALIHLTLRSTGRGG